MDAYVARRSGWDGPNRIATTAEMTTLATELLPGETMYQPIPFYPSIVDGSGASLNGVTSLDSWVNSPSRVDLTWYQGDDVTITLIIQDPSDSTPDMSTSWDWTAQIRLAHNYHAALVNTFSVMDAYTAPVVGPPAEIGYTTVTLFLARSENRYVGTFNWDLYSKSPFYLTDLPRPPDVPAPEPWPPADQIRTWLYGEVSILPRVTSTDILDDDLVSVGGGGAVQMTYFVGPNGRVP